MTMFKKATIAAALFAGSALSSFPLLAQDGSNSQKPITPSQTQQDSQSSQGAASAESGAQMKEQTGSADSSAKADAQIKPQGDQPADDTAASSDKAASGSQAQSDPINRPGSTDAKSAKTDSANQDGQAAKPAEDTAATRNQQPDSRNSAQSGTQDADPDRQSAQGSGQNGTSDMNKSDTAQDDSGQSDINSADSADRPSNEITGSVNISAEQKTEIRNVIVENKVETVKPTFSVSIGVAVPKTVKLHPLPPKVVEIVPQYKSYEYFVLADNRIIIVEPSTYEIVYIVVL